MNIVEVNQLSKTYKKNQNNHTYFQKRIGKKWRNLSQTNNIVDEKINALSSVSFSIKKGDVLGIIGRNGAGKTTLLNILAGTVQPTTGSAWYKGKLVSILEFGTGFHPDLTGKENIYLNASLLGMSKADLKNKYESIVAFSELSEDMINEPVKLYSNGMYLRLAFSVFSHLTSDILLLDEVMTVGDFPFRQKCYNQISQLANSGTTIIMVSHYPDQIKSLCNKCLWLENGSLNAFGDTSSVLESYLEKYLVDEGDSRVGSVLIQNCYLHFTNGLIIKDEIKISRFGLKARDKNENEPILLTDGFEIEIEFEKLNSEGSIEITICILSMYEAWVLVDSYALYSKFEGIVTGQGNYLCKCLIPGNILNFGNYQLGILVSKSEQLIYQNPYLLTFKIELPQIEEVKNYVAKETKGIIKPLGDWKVYKL